MAEFIVEEYALPNTKQYSDSSLLLYALYNKQIENLAIYPSNMKFYQDLRLSYIQKRDELINSFQRQSLHFGYFLSYYINSPEHTSKHWTFCDIKRQYFNPYFALEKFSKENMRQFIHFGYDVD